MPVANSPYSEADGKISPDDHWLAYASDENGAHELYVTPFPGGGSKWQVSTGAMAFTADNQTSTADWSPDGKSLRYIRGDKVYSVEFRVAGGKPEFSAPKELMTVPHDIDILSIMPGASARWPPGSSAITASLP